MTNDTSPSPNPDHSKQPIPFGTRLKTAREESGLACKDVAAQLRLSEKIILMMEKDRYPADLPVTFIRGYLRAYSKLLKIPDFEVRKALEPIKPKATAYSSLLASAPPVTSGHYFMQLFTYLIILTILGLVATWWYTHPASPANKEIATITSPEPTPAIITPPVAENALPQPEVKPMAKEMPPASDKPVVQQMAKITKTPAKPVSPTVEEADTDYDNTD